MYSLFAEGALDVAGGSGWAGAGLLGAVLCWLLLQHLPAKDKLIQKLIEDHLKAEKEQREEFTDMLDRQRESFMAALREERNEFRKMLDSSRCQALPNRGSGPFPPNLP